MTTPLKVPASSGSNVSSPKNSSPSTSPVGAVPLKSGPAANSPKATSHAKPSHEKSDSDLDSDDANAPASKHPEKLKKFKSLQKIWNELDVNDELSTVEEDAVIKKMEDDALSRKGPAKPVSLTDSARIQMLRLSKSQKLFSFKGKVQMPLTQDQLKHMHEGFASGTILPSDSATEIVTAMRDQLARTKGQNIRKIQVPEFGRITVVGDIHGQLGDLLHILSKQGWPSETNQYLFNGDFVDRGSNSAEVMLLIYSMCLVFPNMVHVNRGNHESRAMNSKYSFEDEILKKYDRALYDHIHQTFELLPMASIVQEKLFVVHGGLFSNDVTVEELTRVDSVREIPIASKKPQDLPFTEAMWSDPRPIHGREKNKRGAGIYWGGDVTKKFLELNSLHLVIRSHEMMEDGYQFLHDNRCLTLFSASNYCGKNKNYGAFVVFNGNDSELKPKFHKYRVAPRELQRQDSTRSLNELRDDTVKQLREKIFVNKAALQQYWEKIHPSKVTREQWAEGINHVVGLKVELADWAEVAQYLVKHDSAGYVHYKEWLHSVRIQLPIAAVKQYDRLVEKICAKIYAHIGDLTEAFKKFDHDQSGSLSLAEFTAAMKTIDTGLSEKGIADFFRIVDADKDGKVTLSEFCSRFQIIYNKLKSERQKAQEWVPAAISRIIDALAQSGKTTADFDTNKSGRVSYSEFSAVLKSLPSLTLSHEQRKALAEFLDDDRDGHIDVRELESHFQAHATQSGWKDDVVNRLVGSLFSYRHHLKRIFRRLDSDDSGDLDFTEFKSGLIALNVILKEQFTDSQIREIFDMFDKDKSGTIDADEFSTFFAALKLSGDQQERDESPARGVSSPKESHITSSTPPLPSQAAPPPSSSSAPTSPKDKKEKSDKKDKKAHK